MTKLNGFINSACVVIVKSWQEHSQYHRQGRAVKMLTAVFYRSSWSSLWLMVTIIGSFSVVSNNAKDGQQIERKGTEQQSWSNLGEFLALSRVNEIEDAGSLFLNKDELILRLNREPRKMFAFPTAVSTGANISQRCVEDSLFYVESLFLNHARWALQSKPSF